MNLKVNSACELTAEGIINWRHYCHLKLRCVKCAGSHSTTQCPHKERLSDVRCVLCGGNHPANYKGCTVYQDLQQKTFPPICPKNLHSPSLSQTNPTYPIRSNIHKSPNAIPLPPSYWW
jgi:hypothetical protein